tara:strand:+ start:273 stop:599 length:327 start_codon:yes stop_codon:yes gene_type:complete
MAREKNSEEIEKGLLARARKYIRNTSKRLIYSQPERKVEIETTKENKGYSHRLLIDGEPYKIPEGADIAQTYMDQNKRRLDLEGLDKIVAVFFIPPKKRFKLNRQNKT